MLVDVVLLRQWLWPLVSDMAGSAEVEVEAAETVVVVAEWLVGVEWEEAEGEVLVLVLEMAASRLRRALPLVLVVLPRVLAGALMVVPVAVGEAEGVPRSFPQIHLPPYQYRRPW